MLKKRAAICLAAVFLIINMFAVPVWGATKEEDYNAAAVSKIIDKTDVFSLKAKGAILIDCATGFVLVEQNSHAKLPIASVTKVMTMLLIMEAVDSGKLTYQDTVPVTENSFRMGGSQVWLEPGEQFTVDEMLKAVAIRSANDAAVAFAEKIAGSEEAFVGMMNQKAKELGMNDTNFLDATGLTDEGHYSSAHDVALMSRELVMKHPDILKYTSTWHSTFRDNVQGKKPVSLDNTNKLIRFYQGTNGLKTGFTSKAGHCLSASVKRNNLQLVSVVIGEPDSNTRFAESKKLMDYGFANFESTRINEKGEEVQNVIVKKGLKDSVKAIYGDNVSLLVKKGEKDKVERDIKLDESVTAPVTTGQKVGEAVYRIGDNEVYRVELVAAEDVQKASFVKVFIGMVLEWFGIGRTSA